MDVVKPLSKSQIRRFAVCEAFISLAVIDTTSGRFHTDAFLDEVESTGMIVAVLDNDYKLIEDYGKTWYAYLAEDLGL